MAKPLTAEERERIIAAFPSGRSCRQIAREFGRSTTTISHIARDVGHQFGQINTARAREINQAYGAEWRAEMRERLAAEALRLLEDMRKPYLVYAFGGKENVYNEETLSEPDAPAKRGLMQATATALQTILRLDASDRTSSDQGLLAAWFAQIDNEAREYRDPAADGEAGVVDRDQ